MKILSYLAEGAATISQIAERLGVHPANITHHFRLLEKQGLIELMASRNHGSYIERFYLAAALSYDIAPPPGEIEHANAKVLSFLRNDLSAAIAGLKRDDSESVLGLIKVVKVEPARFAEFAEKLRDLIRAFGAQEAASGIPYALNVSLYPSKADYGPLKTIHIQKKPKTLKSVGKDLSK